MALTDVKCRNAKATDKQQKFFDDGGLFLLIKPIGPKTPNGSKHWRLKYRFGGKEKLLAIGPYPVVSLLQARNARETAKEQLAIGIDPAMVKQKAKQPEHPPMPEINPVDSARKFKAVAKQWHMAKQARWKLNYAIRIWARLEADVFPAIGEMDVAEIGPPEVLNLIKSVEDRGALDLARRHRQNISGVFRFAIASGLCKYDPAASIGEAMAEKPPAVNRAFIAEADLPAFFAKLHLSGMEEQTALGLRLVIHTALRTSEARFGRWDEIQGDAWLIPAVRMKMKRPHRVVITPEVAAILKRLKEIASNSPWIFPGVDGLKPISENTLLFALYNCGYRSRATVHGFRTTFSTAANNSGKFRSDVIELAIAHTDGSSVRGVYNKASNWPERVELANWWSARVQDYEKQGLAKLKEREALLEGLL